MARYFPAYNNPDPFSFRNLKMEINIKENDGGITITVRVIPRSSKTEILGEHDGAVKVKLSSPPVEGAANDELVRLLAKEFGISRSAVNIISGQTSKTKRVRISGTTASQVLTVLKAKS